MLAEPPCSDINRFLLDMPESLNGKHIVLKDLLYIILGLSLNPSFNTSDGAGQSHKVLNSSPQNVCLMLPAPHGDEGGGMGWPQRFYFLSTLIAGFCLSDFFFNPPLNCFIVR